VQKQELNLAFVTARTIKEAGELAAQGRRRRLVHPRLWSVVQQVVGSPVFHHDKGCRICLCCTVVTSVDFLQRVPQLLQQWKA
jgi:hypothetical protein